MGGRSQGVAAPQSQPSPGLLNFAQSLPSFANTDFSQPTGSKGGQGSLANIPPQGAIQPPTIAPQRPTALPLGGGGQTLGEARPGLFAIPQFNLPSLPSAFGIQPQPRPISRHLPESEVARDPITIQPTGGIGVGRNRRISGHG